MNWTLFWILVAVLTGLYVLWTYLYQAEFIKLSTLLYRSGDADAYLKELETFQAKIFYPEHMRKLMSIDAYLAKKDDARVKALFEEIDGFKLRGGDRLTFLQKEVTFYADQKDAEKAKAAFAKMQETRGTLSGKNAQYYDSILEECRYTMAIKVDQDGQYAEDLVKKAKEVKDGIPAGVYLYKAAQSFYLRKDMKMARQKLDEAEVKLRSTPYDAAIRGILADRDLSGIMDQKI